MNRSSSNHESHGEPGSPDMHMKMVHFTAFGRHSKGHQERPTQVRGGAVTPGQHGAAHHVHKDHGFTWESLKSRQLHVHELKNLLQTICTRSRR